MTSLDWTPADLATLGGRRVLVVGDLILDRYLWGGAERVSPEAPVLVLEYEGENTLLGGAGNVVSNLCAAGAIAIPCGAVGADDNGARIRRMFTELGAPVGGVLTDRSRPTIEKTRVLAGNQQILRIDRERRHGLDGRLRERLLAFIERQLDTCCGVIVSDYGKGVLAPSGGHALIPRLAALCHRRGLTVVADPKGTDYRRYAGVDFITPNQKEAQAASGVAIEDEASLARAARALLRQTRGQGVVITRGHDGSALFRQRRMPFLAPAHPREVYDVTGAGDTFIAYFALALFAGHAPEKALTLGNLAGGLAVEKVGAAPVSRDEIRRELAH